MAAGMRGPHLPVTGSPLPGDRGHRLAGIFGEQIAPVMLAGAAALLLDSAETWQPADHTGQSTCAVNYQHRDRRRPCRSLTGLARDGRLPLTPRVRLR